MTTTKQTKITRSAATAIATLALMTPAAFAQDDPVAANQRMQRSRHLAASTLLSIEFKGGSVKNFITQLRAVFSKTTGGERFNLILTGNPDAVRLPAFDLYDTTVHDALEALESVARDKDNMVRVSSKTQRRGGKTIYVLQSIGAQKTKRVESRRRYRPTTRSVVFSIRNLTGSDNQHGYKLEAVLGAVEAGLEIARDPDEDPNSGYRPVVRHHSASGLLFVRAKGDDVNMIQSVLSQLEQDMRRRMSQHFTPGRPSKGAGGSSVSPAGGKRSDTRTKRGSAR